MSVLRSPILRHPGGSSASAWVGKWSGAIRAIRRHSFRTVTIGLRSGKCKAPSTPNFDRKKNLGLHHLALKVSDIESLNILFRKISMWPGVAVEFAPEPVGKGPKVHFMVAVTGGIRVEFACTPQNG
jgi:hypothetical protein